MTRYRAHHIALVVVVAVVLVGSVAWATASGPRTPTIVEASTPTPAVVHFESRGPTPQNLNVTDVDGRPLEAVCDWYFSEVDTFASVFAGSIDSDGADPSGEEAGAVQRSTVDERSAELEAVRNRAPAQLASEAGRFAGYAAYLATTGEPVPFVHRELAPADDAAHVVYDHCGADTVELALTDDTVVGVPDVLEATDRALFKLTRHPSSPPSTDGPSDGHGVVLVKATGDEALEVLTRYDQAPPWAMAPGQFARFVATEGLEVTTVAGIGSSCLRCTDRLWTIAATSLEPGDYTLVSMPPNHHDPVDPYRFGPDTIHEFTVE